MVRFQSTPIWRYGVAVLSTALVTGLTILLQPYLSHGVMALFTASLMISAWYGGLGPGLLSSALSVLVSQYFFFPPIHSLAVDSRDDVAQIVVFSILTLLICLLTSAQKRAIKAVVESKGRLQEFAEAVWDQQRRLASELHDSLGQELTGLGFLSRSLAQSTKGAPSAETAGQIQRVAEQSLERIRAMAKGVMPVERESDGLTSALGQLAATVSSVYHVPCRFDCPQPVLLEDHQAASQLYRIAQEAVTNAMKHAKARSVVIYLEKTREGLTLRITDDGVGLPEQVLSAGGGSGLKIMKYRALALGASLRFEKNPPGGTLVNIFIPATLARPLETGPLA